MSLNFEENGWNYVEITLTIRDTLSAFNVNISFSFGTKCSEWWRILKSFQSTDSCFVFGVCFWDFVSTIVRGSHTFWWPATKSRVFIFLDKILFKCITKHGLGWLERKTSRVFSVTFLRCAWLLRTFRLKSERIKNIKITTSSEKWNVCHQSNFGAYMRSWDVGIVSFNCPSGQH